MPQHVQPMSLLDLSYGALKSTLLGICQILHQKKIPPRQLHQFWVDLLPTPMRKRLLKSVVDIRDGPLPFYLMGLLLTPDIDELKVELCCYYGCSHQASVLRLLATEGKGLKTLEISRSALLRLDQCLLQSVLLNAEGLQHLVMRNFATDATLSVIGSSCKNLITLDISNSRQITDAGVKQLFLQIELRKKTDNSDRNNCAVAITTRSSGWNFMDRTTRRIQRVFGRCLGNSSPNRSDSCKDFLLECYESRTALSSTLRVLNMTNTSVTSIGVLVALENCSNLQSVGDYAHIYQALELVRTRGKQSAPLQLLNVRNTLTYVRSLELIFKLCPGLQQLCVLDTRFMPNELIQLNLTPINLKSLILLMIPALDTWVQQFCKFLTITPSITELTLIFNALVDIELDDLLQACPTLKILVIDGANIDYKARRSKSSNLLQKIQLGQNISSSVLVNLLSDSPDLITAHFYNCPDIADLSCLAHSTLECFYIYESKLTNIPVDIQSIFANFPQLQLIGNIKNWGKHYNFNSTLSHLDYLKLRNYNVQLEAGAHWYHSKCIHNYE